MKRILVGAVICGATISANAQRGAMQNISSAKKLIREGVHLAQDRIDWVEDRLGFVPNNGPYGGALLFRPTFYKLRMAQNELSTLSHSAEKQGAIGAIGVAIEKINDEYLTIPEKMEFLIDCSKVAQGHLNQLILKSAHGRLGKALMLNDAAVDSLVYGDLISAELSLLQVKGILSNYGNHDADINAAKNATKLSLEKLADPFLNEQEVIDFVKDCSRMFKQKVLQSRTYRFEGGHGRPTPPPVRPIPPRQPPRAGPLDCKTYTKSGFTVGGRQAGQSTKTCRNNTASGRVFVHGVRAVEFSDFLGCRSRIHGNGKDVDVQCFNRARSSKRVEQIEVKCCNRRA